MDNLIYEHGVKNSNPTVNFKIRYYNQSTAYSRNVKVFWKLETTSAFGFLSQSHYFFQGDNIGKEPHLGSQPPQLLWWGRII